MELKVIHREGHPEEVIAAPTMEGGIFTAVVRNNKDDYPFDKVGRGILLSNIPAEDVQRVKEDPTFELEEFLEPHAEREGAFVLRNGAAGTIFEIIDRHGDLIDSQPMALGTFTEYIPYGTLL